MSVTGFTCAQPRWPHPWHADASCTRLAAEVRDERFFRRDGKVGLVDAPTWTALEASQSSQMRTACRPCTYNALLGELETHATNTAGGYHYVRCSKWVILGRGCDQCAALNTYAAEARLPAGDCFGHAAVLAPGLLDTAACSLVSRLGLSLVEAAWAGPGPVSAPVWATALTLLGREVPLAQALAAAQALHNPPADA